MCGKPHDTRKTPRSLTSRGGSHRRGQPAEDTVRAIIPRVVWKQLPGNITAVNTSRPVLANFSRALPCRRCRRIAGTSRGGPP